MRLELSILENFSFIDGFLKEIYEKKHKQKETKTYQQRNLFGRSFLLLYKDTMIWLDLFIRLEIEIFGCVFLPNVVLNRFLVKILHIDCCTL